VCIYLPAGVCDGVGVAKELAPKQKNNVIDAVLQQLLAIVAFFST